MTTVDPVYAQWLMADTMWAVSTDAARATRWGSDALTTSRQTTIATKADALAEGARQIAFLGGPLAIEEHVLPGEWASSLGTVVTLTIGQIGYDAGIDVFVIGVEDSLSQGTSTLTVIRRL